MPRQGPPRPIPRPLLPSPDWFQVIEPSPPPPRFGTFNVDLPGGPPGWFYVVLGIAMMGLPVAFWAARH